MTPDQRSQMLDAMFATSAALSRLLLRMQTMAHSARYHADGKVDRPAHWKISELTPPSPLIAGMPDIALSGAIVRVLSVQARLLCAATSGDEIDPKWVCRVLQALGDDFALRFSPLVLRMAEITGVELPSEPRDLHHGRALRDEITPGEWRPKPAGPFIAR